MAPEPATNIDFEGLVNARYVGGVPTVDGFLPSLLDRSGAPLAAFLEQLLGVSGPVLLHCHTGKDRTGFLVAMTLALLGVDDEAIMVDYLRTQPVFDQMIRNLEAVGLGIPDRLHAVIGQVHLNAWHTPNYTPTCPQASSAYDAEGGQQGPVTAGHSATTWQPHSVICSRRSIIVASSTCWARSVSILSAAS